tara:strand:+ start:15553 stop:17001 length:1449 start_codon:yes stop_codon:yes gene_type:complete
MRKAFLTILTVVSCSLAWGQTSLSFHHLGNTTFQNTLINASYIPNGKVFFGLPAMSGIHASYNNKLSYNNIFSKVDNSLVVDTRKILGALQKRNMTSVETDINLFHLGYTSATGATIYLFANERINADFLYPKELLEFIVEGNAGLADETLKIGKTQLNLTHFREMGVGYRYYIDDANLGLGFRLKYYQGFFNMSTPGNFTADIVTESENYQLNLEMKNAALRSSGRDIYAGNTGDLASHLISNGNSGFGLDFGFEFDMGQYLTIAGSVNDIGFISWKEDIRNYTLNDTTMRYTGVSLREINDVVQVVKDSLVGKFKNELENNDPYNTLMAPRAYLSGKYHLTSTNDVTATVATRYVQGQFKMLYGIGINHQVGNFLTASINATKYPQQIPNLGAAVAIKGGPAQFYLAVDQVAYWSVPDFKSLDFRVGINFIIGSSEGVSEKSPAKSIFLGKEVEVKGQEGIYTIIDRQKKREVDTNTPER